MMLRAYDYGQPDKKAVIKKILLSISVFILVSCATTSSVELDNALAKSWQQRQQSLANLTSWEISGRILLRAQDEGHQMNLRWMRRGDHHEIDLSGPLNSGHVRLTRGPDSAKLVTENKTYHAKDAEQLLADINGWRLPINGLDYWIRGMPSPDSDSEQFLDHRNRLQQLIQSEWEILYQQYSRVGELELPRIIFIKRVPAVTDTAAENIELRMVISSWN